MNRKIFHALTALAILSTCSAQTAQPPFEVVSIRPNHSGDARSAVYFQPGRFVAENATVRMIIAYAYQVKDFQISGGPSWMDSERFNITAKKEDFVAEARQKLPWKQYREQLGLMVQALLADRFHLKVIHQPKDSPILALVTAKGESKLERSALDGHDADFRGRRGQLIAKGVSLAQLADVLSWEPELGTRKVVDQTGIAGNFDVTLRWIWDRNPADGPPSHSALQADAASPSLFAAVQEQLGLKLEPTRGPVDFIVIDQLEEPAGN